MSRVTALGGETLSGKNSVLSKIAYFQPPQGIDGTVDSVVTSAAGSFTARKWRVMVADRQTDRLTEGVADLLRWRPGNTANSRL